MSNHRSDTGRRGFSLMEVCFSLAITGMAVLTSMGLVGAGVKSQAMAKQRCLAAALATYVVATYGDDYRQPMSAADRAVKTLASQLATAPGLVVEPGSNLDLPGKDPSAPLYRFVPVAGSADPYGPLVFQASGPVTNGTVSTQYRLLRVWTCATNATLPAGVTFQGTQVGLFLYRDFQDAL